MDDGSQKLLDVIDDPSALESFLGISAAAAGESSSRTTLESLVDSLQQGLLDPSTTTSGGGTSARHVPTGTPHSAHAGSVVLTQHQLQQLQQFQAGNATGRPHGQSVAFTLPPHSNTSPVVSSSSSSSSSAATVVCSSSCIPVSTHHFVLTPLHHTGGGSTTHPHPSSHPITLINSSGQQPGGTLVSTSVSQPSTSFIYTPASSASPSFSTSGSIPTTGLQLGNPNVTIGHGGTILATPAAGLHLGATVPPAGMPVIGSTVGNSSIQSLTSNSTAGGSLFGASIIPAANSSASSGVLVGPSGTTVFTPALATNAISSPGSPFSVPTRSPAPHAPPTPSPSPLPLRSPASVPSHHPPSPAPSPYHTQLQSPQQQQQGSVANPPYILSTSASQTSPANLLKEHYGSLQPHVVSSSQTPTSFVLSTANATFKDVYNMQQPSSQPPPQPSVVVLPQQRSSLSGSTTNTSPSPAQSPYSNLQSPVSQQNANMLNQHLVQHIGNNSVAPTRSPAPGGAQPAGTITSGGALTPAPSPSPQTRTAASPVIRSTTPQPTVIHQTLPTGLALSGTGQFPVIPPGSTTMLQGNHQLVQIIHHQTAAPPTTTFPSHTQIITTAGPGGTVPIHQSGTTVGGPLKPKQPPQILPKPPSGQPSSGSHTKLAANSRSTSTQHQGLHTQHHTTAPAAQVVIGQANHSTVIPTAQAGTLLLNPVIPGLGAGGPVLVQPNPSGGVQLILRSPTPGTQATSPAQSSQQNQQQQGKSPTSHQQSMFISGAATAQLIQSTGRQQMQQVLRLFTSQGPMQLQQIQTPSGPTFIAVPSSQTLSFQQLGPQAPPPPAVPPQQPQIPPQPSSGTRSSAPQQPSSGSQQPATPIIPTVQLHQGNMRPSPNVGVPTSRTGCTPQQSVSAVIGGHTIALNANSSTTSSIIHQNHPQVQAQVQPPVSGVVPQSQQDVTPSQQNVTFPIMRHNTPVLQTQQHQCTGTNTETSILALSQKRKTKKKKKKKKDEEPKLDLANIMKLSGIGDDEDLALYDAEEPAIAPASQSPAPSEINTQQSPVSQTQTAQQQSQLIAQLRSPPQIPLQNATGGTASLRLALEDGHVVLHHTPSDSQQSAANILLQNFPSTVGQQQQQHSVSTAQNQLSALLASGSCSSAPSAGGASNHVVLSQLLQQTSPSGPSPHLISTSTNTSTARGTNSTSPNPLPSTAANSLQPHSQERFSMLQQQGVKSGFLKDAFSSSEIANSGISQITTSIAGNLDGNLANAVPGTFGIQAKSPAGTVSCANFRDGFVHPGSNKVDSSTSTCPKTSPMSSPGLVLSSHENTTSLLLAKPPHQHTCHQEVTLKPPQDTIQKQSSATTQTELIHPGIHLGPKQHEPVPFIPASKTGADAGPTFLGLHPFSNIQGLVSTTGGSIPLVTAPVMTSGSGNFGGEQLLIAHHAGMSVLAAPQLIQCLQQTQNAATPGIINMPQLHLTQSAINKAIGQGLAFNTPTGTILIGGSPETFSAAVTNQHKPSIVTANNNAATKLLPQQPSVLLQQLNTGTANAVRRCSSDSNNSSISIGSPPPGGGAATSGTTAVIGLINQPMVSQSTSATSASTGTRKNQQSIETQTISLGIPTTNSLQTTFLDNIVHTHPNLVRLVQPTATSVHTGKKKKQKQPRMSKILPGVTSANIIVNRQCNSTGTTTDLVKSPLQERNFSKPTTVCQGTQHVTRTTGNDASFYVTAPPFTFAQQSVRVSTVSCNTSNTNSVPPLPSICSVVQNTPTNILCQVGSTATSTATTMATLQSVMSKVAANLGVQTVAADAAATSSGHHHLTPSASKPGMQHHCVASQTVSLQQPQSGMVPHLVPIPAGGNTVSSGTAQAAAVGMQSIIQKVQTIQLTPQNQKHLKAVQMQIQSVTSKRALTSTDQAALHRLYDEQQRILLTGKVVPTIPGQHAVGLPLNPDVIPSSVDGKLKSQAEVELNTANTHLANLLRQQLVVPHQTTQMPVRYQHQVGNQIIPLTPANLQQKPAPSSSVATTTTTASTVTTRASISVQCGTHLSPSDALIQQPVGLATQSLPKLSVVQPMLQATGTTSVSSSQQCKSTGQPSSCEKGTSPLQVQVGTQTTLPCIESSSSSSSSCSPHLSMATSVCSGKLSPAVVSSAPCNSSTSKLSPVPGQQLFSPGKVQPVFVASATNAKVQQSFSPTGSNKPCQPSVLGCKVLTSGGKPQAVVAPVSPSGSASSRSSPAMASVPSGTPATVVVGGMPVTGSGKRPTVTTSPIRPNFSRSDLIEQQLKTDQGGACMPDTCTPFQSTSDACKRLIRYHVFNEQLLSQQDLEKADEFFEATAKHLLDKFRQMMNKYRYLLLMESMREVNTSELMMIDRMFVAEEHSLLERLKEEERRAKEEPVVPAEQQPSSPPPAAVLTTIKTEPGLPTSGGTATGEGLREVRVVVRDVMKNESIKRELEEDRKFTIVKRERLDSPSSNKVLHQAYDEWEEIQKELAVYCGSNNITASGSTGNPTLTPAIKVEEVPKAPQQLSDDRLCLSTAVSVKAESDSISLDLKLVEAEGKVQPHGDNIDDIQKLPSAGSPGTKARSGACGPRDEGGGTQEEVNMTQCSEDGVGEKRKEFCDTNIDGMASVGHRKKRHKHGYSPQQSECVDDKDDDINAQVQSAIDSILNLKRSDDGFDIRPNATAPSHIGVDEGLDCEDTRQYPTTERTESATSSSKQCSTSASEIIRTRHKRNSVSCKPVDQQVVNHHEDSSSVDNTDSALDEAVRSILTS